MTPNTRLQVKDSVDNTYESGLSVVRSADGATTWINLRGGATNFNNRNNAGNAGLKYRWFQNSSEKMTLDTSGNLGIGTAGPEGKLHIYTGNSGGSVNSSADELVIEAASSGGIQFLNGSTASGYILFGDSGGNSTGQIRYLHSDNSMRLTTANVERMQIDSSGNVGIGSASPAVTLDIVSNDANPVKIYRNGVNASYEAQNNADQVYFGVNTYGNAAIGHALNQIAAPLQITSAGNVGIGVTNPSQPLHILDGNAPSGTPFANGSMLIAGHSTIGLNFYGNDSSAQHIYFGSPSDNTGASIRYEYDGFGSSVPELRICLLYTSPSPRDRQKSRMPSSA